MQPFLFGGKTGVQPRAMAPSTASAWPPFDTARGYGDAADRLWMQGGSSSAGGRGEHLVEPAARLSVLLGDGVGVGVQGDADVGVPEPLLHDLVVTDDHTPDGLGGVATTGPSA